MKRINGRLDPCAENGSSFAGCDRPPLERLRFWNGRFLVARDLRHQQEDLIRRIEYHQSFAHGEGILCGFSIREHPRVKCRDKWLVVERGMGYDCCGRTLWMPNPKAVEVPWPDRPAQEAESPDGSRLGDEERPKEKRKSRRRREEPEPPPAGTPSEPEWFILACPIECPTDPMPALYAEDFCEPIRHQHGSVREDVEIKAVPASEVSAECWPRRSPVTDDDCDQPVADDCGSPLGDTRPCAHRCACGDCLVLAGVWREPGTGVLRWDTTHRKVLTPNADLTRVNGVNWPHGGELTAAELLRERKGRLVVRFSRPLLPKDGYRTGVNPMTFTASYLGPTGSFEQIVPPEPGERGPETPRLSTNRRCAIFEIPESLRRGRVTIVGTHIHVRLLCDFLLDCHGRPVSGAHIAGDVNGRGTGNGAPGGVFESWFYVKG